MSTHQVMADDLTLYAMGALEAAEMAKVGAHLEECVTCRSELQRIHADLGEFAMAAAPETQPPARVKDRLMREIASEVRAAEVSSRSRESSGYRWWFALPSLAAVILALGLVFVSHQNVGMRREIFALHDRIESERLQTEDAKRVLDTLNAPDATRVTLVSTNSKPQPQAQTIYSKGSGHLVLVASNMQPVPGNMAYELWLLPMSGAAPVPAGMFKPDERGNAQLLLPDLPSGMEAKGFAVTVEPEAGSSAPTSPIMMVGTAQ
jgi:anti-sigma-K factor RskA